MTKCNEVHLLKYILLYTIFGRHFLINYLQITRCIKAKFMHVYLHWQTDKKRENTQGRLVPQVKKYSKC